MRNGFLSSLIILVATAGLVVSDEPRSSAPASPLGAASPINVQTPLLMPENGAAPWFAEESGGIGQGGSRFWGSAEFLLWWIKAGNVPPLATTSPPDSFGILGAPGTTTLFGGHLNHDALPGARFSLGVGLDCEGKKGIEVSYFFLNGGSPGFGASSDGAAGSAVLARPFFNVLTGMQSEQLVAFPGILGGSIGISSSSALQGADLNLYCNLCCRPTSCNSYRLDLLAGPIWLALRENLVITEQLTDGVTAFTIVDRFETRNTFYGGQIGARAEWQQGRWFVNLLGKVALGDTHQVVRISGTSTFTEPGVAPIVQQGGLLALPTNIGSYSRDKFSVVPQININVGCQVTNHLRAFAGYTYLYWSNIVRPGDQIDFGINPTQLPSAAGPGTLVGPARPAFAFHATDFWAQGINAGLEFGW